MEIRITPLRLLLLTLLIAGFWWIGGFDPSSALPSDARNNRAMFYRAILFVLGAGCITVVEHESGTLDRTNLRPLYIILGLLLITAAVFWTRSLHVS